MKILILTFVCLLLVACNGTGSSEEKASSLPWQIETSESGQTSVLGISPGQIKLREFAQHFHELADVRLFEKPDGTLFLEAYLGKTRIGKFDARLVAELDAPEDLLQSVRLANLNREPTPNNYWQYNLNDEQLLQALEARVWRFMYIPVADYEERQIGFFGTPSAIVKENDTAEYRFYPEKGLVVLWDTASKETFYYVAPKEFSRLKAALEADKKPTTLGDKFGKNS